MKVATKRSAESDRFLRQALVGFLALILRTGTSIKELRALASECLELAAHEGESMTRRRGLDIHRLASILRAWHRETRYLSNDGRPSPLSLRGKKGLHALVAAYYPQARVAHVLSTLKRAHLIKRYGEDQWLPTETHVRISSDSQETLDHVSEGISRFLETVMNNVNSRSKTTLLFEQSCKVHRLPTSNAAAFRAFVRQQAIVFLTAVDDWLEARVERAGRRRKKSKTCSAGAFAFAYIDPLKTIRESKKIRNQ